MPVLRQHRITPRHFAAVSSTDGIIANNPSLEDLENQTAREHKAVRIQKLEEMRSAGIEPFAYSFAPSHNSMKFATQFETLGLGMEDPTLVSMAGRIIARRMFGKLMFFTIQVYYY
jgi:lysyl-tRNA synthetase, class II